MNLFSELVKRRVFATGAIYIPAAWLAAEILLAIFDRFNAPDWAGDVVVVLFLLGFPVALLLSWLFDLTAHGVRRASAGTPLGILVLLASGLFLSAGAFISYQVFSGKLSEVRVAILPLKTSALNEAAAPYGVGIADDLRSALRKVPAFRVPAQTSSEAVLKAGLDIPGIAARLGVEYILEGTLEMLNDRLEVQVTLLDSDGKALWSESFEQATRDLFDLQNELVLALAIRLGIREDDPYLQAEVRSAPPTSDPEAYRLYLQGRYLPYPQGSRVIEGARIETLKAARQRDPGFAEVYVVLAYDYAMDCWALDDRKSTSCDMALNHAKHALKLDPEIAEAWTVLAMVSALRYDWTGAQKAIDQYSALPSKEVVSPALSIAYLNLGRSQQAWDSCIEFYQNDPMNWLSTGMLANWAWLLAENRELADYYDAQTLELSGFSTLWSFYEASVHRVPLEQAIENARKAGHGFDVDVDEAAIFVPVAYGIAPPESTWDTIDQWVNDGEVRAAQYWSMLPRANRVNDFIDLSFELYDENTLNPPFMLSSIPNHEAIRTHPRFIELMEYIGYAEYWDKVGWPRYCSVQNGQRVCGKGASVVVGDS